MQPMIHSHPPLKKTARKNSSGVATPAPTRVAFKAKTHTLAMPSLTSRTESSHWPPQQKQLDTPDEAARKATLDWEARQVSEKIDLGISVERTRSKKNKAVKILLLGQSESGKSTTLRNFQLNLAPRAFQEDADAWRTVIHLNLLMSVNYLLDVLKTSRNLTAGTEQRSPYSVSTPSRKLIERERSRLLSLDGSFGYVPDARTGGQSVQQTYSPELRHLMLSLLPLKSIETTLRRRLGADSPPSNFAVSEKERATDDAPQTSVQHEIPRRPSDPFIRPASVQSSTSGSSGARQSRHVFGFRRHSISSSGTSSTSSITATNPIDFSLHTSGPPSAYPYADTSTRDRQNHHRQNSRLQCFVDSFAVRVRGSTGWKRRARIPDSSGLNGGNNLSTDDEASGDRNSRRPSLDSMTEQEEKELVSARQIIQVFGEDIDRLWHNEDVQSLLKHQSTKLENRPGFFLNDVLRITAFDYVPTTADILRARLQTTGVEEHRLVLETGQRAGKEWIIYDVGGFRSQRAAWAPFFDSVNTIIFLAPISSFDEWLAEDPSINRLEDTFNLWRDLCSNRLLASVEFILFLNKYDALRAKLRSGIRFADYVINYDDKDGTGNDAESIARYMLAAFNATHKRLSPRPRKLRTYLTSVIDSRATAKVVNHISEQVLIGHLTDSDVL